MVGTPYSLQMAPLPDDWAAQLVDVPGRVVFGSDFPNIPYPYAHQLEALTRTGLDDDWLRQVVWHNGVRLFGLDADGRTPLTP